MNMTWEEDIAALKQEANGLLTLLNDPHPGLFTWNEFVAKRIQNIARFGGIYGFVADIQRLERRPENE